MECITPIVFFVFNRPDTTQVVFERISGAKPKKLFVIADGPRVGNNEDYKKCKEVKKIVENVTWDCETFYNYSDKNLGCKYRFSSGLDWVFQLVEQAIILEDDCVPCDSFFSYCQILLEEYKDNKTVMSIAGLNTQLQDNCEDSYYFSKHVDIGAWATWKRAWIKNDINISAWPNLSSTTFLDTIIQDRWLRRYTKTILDELYAEKLVSTWDYQWQFAVWMNDGLSIVPQYNLFENIGQGHPDATNGGGASPFDNLKAKEISFPLIHPRDIVRDLKKDLITDGNRRIGRKYKLPYPVFWGARKLYKAWKNRGSR